MEPPGRDRRQNRLNDAAAKTRRIPLERAVRALDDRSIDGDFLTLMKVRRARSASRVPTGASRLGYANTRRVPDSDSERQAMTFVIVTIVTGRFLRRLVPETDRHPAHREQGGQRGQDQS